jgi:hypothetical protein
VTLKVAADLYDVLPAVAATVGVHPSRTDRLSA